MKQYSRLILRVHGTTIILAGVALAVIGWQGTFAGTGMLKVLQTEPLGYIGLFQAYLLMASFGAALWVGSFAANTRPWHAIGFLAHTAPFAANLLFWNLVTDYGVSHSGIILHVVFMLIEAASFVLYEKRVGPPRG